MLSWWRALDPGVQSALIGAGATFVAALLGFSAVIVQIGRQARHAIEQSQAGERTKLKLGIYEEIIAAASVASTAQIECSAYIRDFLMQIQAARDLAADGIPSVPQVRFPELLAKEKAAHLGAMRIITAVERWQIIDARLDLFGVAIGAALHDHMEAFTAKLVPIAIQAMPTDNPDTGQAFPWTPPTTDALREVEQAANDAIEALDTLGSYVADFQVEMQNLLLGDLFEGRVPARQPIDPKYIALRLDKHSEQIRHFETVHPWGLTKARFESEARAKAEEKGRDVLKP